MSTPSIAFEALSPGVEPPRPATRQSAGYDLRACLASGRVRVWPAAVDTPEDRPCRELESREIVLEPGDRALIPTGFRARLPQGYEAQIRIRSSLAWKRGLVVPNAPGTVDADYPDEWFVLVLNASARDQTVADGERVAQVVLHRFERCEWHGEPVAVTTDRTGGLGSTGRS